MMKDPRSIHVNQENQDSSNSNNTREATKTIDCLQQVIQRFSDHHDRISKEDAISFWRLSSSEVATGSGNGRFPQESVSQEAQQPAETWPDTTPTKSTTSINTHESATKQNSNKRTLQDIVHRYAPVGLESQFEQLYCLLHPCLVVREQESNAAAFCLGHRGMGKSILVERCLQAFQDEISCSQVPQTNNSREDNNNDTSTVNIPVVKMPTMFRVVRVHGILIPGHDVGLVVKDMLQQLSQAALQESGDAIMEQLDNNNSPQNINNQPDLNQSSSKSTTPSMNDLERQASKRLKKRKEEQSLRLRMSTFDSNLQLLGETLKLARVDRIPILIVLDEVDAFLGGSSASDSNSQNHSSTSNTNGGSGQMEAIGGRDRQLLFYTLMERVATQNSNICLIGLTQHLALRSKLEKRIKSRMEGVSKEIFVGPCSSMSSLTSILLSHVTPQQTNHIDITAANDASSILNTTSTEDNQENPWTVLHGQISQLLSPPNALEKHNESNVNSVQRRVWETLQREYRMGRSVRWFSRIFTYALSLYRGEWIRYRRRQRCQAENEPTTEKPPLFEACHLLDALVAQGASISTVPRGGSGNQTNSSNKDQNNDKRKRQSNLVIMTGTAKQAPTAVDPRIQALLDLSAPQVCLILTARRLLARDAQWNGETTSPPPLTLGRLLQEYSNFRSNQQRYSRHLLWVSFQELLELNLFRPASDHCGTGPFQYEHQRNVYRSASEAEDIPLHLLLDINREVMEALQSNILECPTALREWARKTNT